MNIEYWKTGKRWYVHFRVNSDITFVSGEGYTRKTDAIRAAEDHIVGLTKWTDSYGLVLAEAFSGASNSEATIRKYIRKMAAEIPSPKVVK